MALVLNVVWWELVGASLADGAVTAYTAVERGISLGPGSGPGQASGPKTGWFRV